MKQQRLVAAIAALAIGFAVTLVGVGVADDEIAADPMEADQDADGGDRDDENEDGERADQEEAVADEPDAAEVEDPDPPMTEPGQPQEGAPPAPAPTSAPAPTNAPNTTSAPDGNQAEPGQDAPFPTVSAECRTVLRLDYTDGSDFVVLLEERGAQTFLILDDVGEYEIDLADEEGLVDVGFVERIVEIQDGRLISIDELCDVDENGTGGDIVDDVGGQASSLGADFPCSDQAFDGLIRPLTTLERTELIDERDVFVRSIAKRLASLGSTSTDDWVFLIDDEFESFTDPRDGCSQQVEAAFIGTDFDFFCAAAQVSSDSDLFVFFQQRVGPAMVGCTYDDQSAQGGN